MSRVHLRVFEDKDLSLFRQWLYKEHVAQWYSEPNDWIYEIENRKGEFNWLNHFIVEVDGVAIGFCQYYDYVLGGETWNNEEDEEGIYSIDYMIGEEEYLGKGYGTEIVLAIVDIVKTNKDARKIVVQPESGNLPSRNTLLAAGFQYDVAKDVFYQKI
jgi:RimJ/RimL family protein N-acetyltransferase